MVGRVVVLNNHHTTTGIRECRYSRPCAACSAHFVTSKSLYCLGEVAYSRPHSGWT